MKVEDSGIEVERACGHRTEVRFIAGVSEQARAGILEAMRGDKCHFCELAEEQEEVGGREPVDESEYTDKGDSLWPK